MYARKLIPIIADSLGLDVDRAFIIDRALAEAGLREKGIGTARPDMTRPEAITFLLAVLGSEVATRAYETVNLWKANHRYGYLSGDLSDNERDRINEILGSLKDELEYLHRKQKKENFRDYLIALCSVIGAKIVAPESVRIEIEIGLMNVICIYEIDGSPVYLDFFSAENSEIDDKFLAAKFQSNRMRRVISGHVLEVIANETEKTT